MHSIIVNINTPFRDNNYTVMNGLQIDMKPALGPLAAKVVIIAENDNAEGVVRFTADALNFHGMSVSNVHIIYFILLL